MTDTVSEVRPLQSFYEVSAAYSLLKETLGNANVDEPESRIALNKFVIDIAAADHSQLSTLDKITLDAFVSSSVEIDHTYIWTTDSFLAATIDMSDAERCAAVLKTRDIVLISWYVNVRAGREVKNHPLQSDLENQLKIIQCELDEAFVSVGELHGYGLRDDVPDMLLTVAGLAGYYKQSINNDFITMVEANFTRIDGTRADAEKTKAKWTAVGIPCEIKETELGTFPVTVTEAVNITKEDGTVEHYPVGKFMKSYQFRGEKYPDDGNTPAIVIA